MRSMLRQNSLAYDKSTGTTTGGEAPMRKNISTPHFGRLTRINSNASCMLSAEKRDSTTNLVYGVQDGTELFLQSRSIFEQRSQAPIIRPLSRKDIFYSGSIFNIAVTSQLPDVPPPDKFEDDDIEDNIYEPGALNRYRHSIISIPKYEKVSHLHRGSIVTSHLDIEPAVRNLTI